MTLPTEPFGWAESAIPADVTEPPVGVRASGYQFEDDLSHGEFNAIVRGLYRWMDFYRLETQAGTHADFSSHDAAQGFVWESEGKSFGTLTANATSNQPAIYRFVRRDEYVYALESDGADSWITRYVIDGDANMASRTVISSFFGRFPGATDSCCMCNTRTWIAFGIDDVLFLLNPETAVVDKSIVRGDAKAFLDVAQYGEDKIVVAANTVLEKYDLQTMIPGASESDALSSWQFDTVAPKTVTSVCATGPYIVAGGFTRNDGKHLAVYRSDSGGTEVGSIAVDALANFVSGIRTDGEYLYTTAEETGNQVFLDKYALIYGKLNVGADIPQDAGLFRVARADSTGAPSSRPVAVDGQYVYTTFDNMVWAFNKSDMSQKSISILGLSATQTICILGVDTKVFIGRATGGASPSLQVSWTGRGPQRYVRPEPVEPRAFYDNIWAV